MPSEATGVLAMARDVLARAASLLTGATVLLASACSAVVDPTSAASPSSASARPTRNAEPPLAARAPGTAHPPVEPRGAPSDSVRSPSVESPAPLGPATPQSSGDPASFRTPLPSAELAASAPAMRYAKLGPVECKKELRKRQLPARPAGGGPGVAAPMRLEGPLGGVTYLAPPARFPFGILDCRLVLVLDELAPVLRSFGIVQVRVDNYYRPRAHLPRKRTRSQHAYGLAADIMAFSLENGATLEVERDWRGRVGAVTCGPTAQLPQTTPEAIALRNLVCEITRRGFFHHLLTPNTNAAHHDHLHFDIARDAHSTMLD